MRTACPRDSSVVCEERSVNTSNTSARIAGAAAVPPSSSLVTSRNKACCSCHSVVLVARGGGGGGGGSSSASRVLVIGGVNEAIPPLPPSPLSARFNVFAPSSNLGSNE